MSKFKVEFTLKQHTPMIHFQADQSGATLRATELKPKLDRFLIERVFGSTTPPEHLIQGQGSALNYKVSIFYCRIFMASCFVDIAKTDI